MGEDVNIVVLQEDGYREVEEQYVRRQRRKGMDTLVESGHGFTNHGRCSDQCVRAVCILILNRSGKPTSSV